MAINVSVLSVRGFDGGGENDPTMTGNNVTAGDLLLVGIAVGSISAAESISGVSYSGGPTFTEIGTTGGFVDDWCRIQWFRAQVVSTASGVTINIDSTNFVFGGCVVLAVTGHDTTTPIVSGSVTQDSAISLSMPTRTSGGLRVAGWQSWHDRTTTPNSGYTEAADTGGGFTLHAFYGLTDNQPAPTFSDTSTGFLAGFGFEVAEAATASDQFVGAIIDDETEEPGEFVFATSGDTDNPPDQIYSVVEADDEPSDEEVIAQPIEDGSGRQAAQLVDEEEAAEDEAVALGSLTDDVAGDPPATWVDEEPEAEGEQAIAGAGDTDNPPDQIAATIEADDELVDDEIVSAFAAEEIVTDQGGSWVDENTPEDEPEVVAVQATEGHELAGSAIEEAEEPEPEQWWSFDATDAPSTDLPLLLIIEDFEPDPNEPEWYFPDSGAPPVASTDVPTLFLGEADPEEVAEFFAAWLAGVAQSTSATLRFGSSGATAALTAGRSGAASALSRTAWDPRAVSGVVAWFDMYTSSTTDSFGWLRPAYVTLTDSLIATDYATGWGVPGMSVSLVTDGAQFLELSSTGFHYAARTTENYWANFTAAGAYTTIRAQFELIDGSDRLLWTGDASTPPTTPVPFEAWWSDTAADARAGANIISRAFETLTATRRRLTVTYRATVDSQAARFGVGRLGTLPSYAGNTAKGFRLYSPEVNQPKVSAVLNRVSGVDSAQATLHGPQPGYESPLVRGIRGYGSQYITCTEADVLAALSGNNPGFTIVLTTKRVGSGTGVILGARTSVGSKFTLGFDSSSRLTVVRGVASLTESSADSGANQVITLIANGTSYTLRRNGSVVASGVVDSGDLTMTGLDLLADGAQGSKYNGHSSDMVIASRALNTAEVSYLEAGLAARLA